MLVYCLSLAFPVAFVAHNVLKIFVALYVVASYDLRRVGNHLLWYSRLSRYLYGERRSWLPYCQLEQWAHLVAVVEHSSVHHALVAVGKVLEVLVVGGYHSVGFLLAKLFQHTLGNGTSYVWLRAASKLVDEQ